MTLDSSLATLIAGDFPSVRLRAPDGAHAQIYLYGGHVTSWNTPDSRERLFMSRRAEFRPGASLRGGVPVIFPQFAGLGPLLKHGFARVSPWEYQGADANSAGVTARFRLTATDDTRRQSVQFALSRHRTPLLAAAGIAVLATLLAARSR